MKLKFSLRLKFGHNFFIISYNIFIVDRFLKKLNKIKCLWPETSECLYGSIIKGLRPRSKGWGQGPSLVRSALHAPRYIGTSAPSADGPAYTPVQGPKIQVSIHIMQDSRESNIEKETITVTTNEHLGKLDTVPLQGIYHQHPVLHSPASELHIQFKY